VLIAITGKKLFLKWKSMVNNMPLSDIILGFMGWVIGLYLYIKIRHSKKH
jgi:hypothetical protein